MVGQVKVQSFIYNIWLQYELVSRVPNEEIVIEGDNHEAFENDGETEAENKDVTDLPDKVKLHAELNACKTVTETLNLIWKQWKEIPRDPNKFHSMPMSIALLLLR